MPARIAKFIVVLAVVSGICMAQRQPASSSSTLIANLHPGETLRYEIEANTSYSAAVMPGFSTNLPLSPCQYAVSSNLTLTVGAIGADGNLPVDARFHSPVVTAWTCDQLKRADMERWLQQFTSQATVFQVGPHGEVYFEHHARKHFSENEASDLLTKVALDLLQTRFADRPVSPGNTWKPHGQFTYWQDPLLDGLELSASTMRWKDTVNIAGADCASVYSAYFFAPTESTSGPVTNGGNVRQAPSNVLAGKQESSFLFDLGSRRIDWLHRFYKVENHVSVQPEDEPDPEALMMRWEEQATARLIPEQDAISWLAALKHFESTPEGRSVPKPNATADASSLAEVARRATHKSRTTKSLSTLDATPNGFVRWERDFCGTMYCFEVSLALPGEVRIVEDTDLQTTYLATMPAGTATITLGPVLARQFQGLTSDEELRKHTDLFLANHLWMSNKPGIQLTSQSTFIDGYPARLTAFRGETRDLSSIRGRLAVLLSSWGESFPVVCTTDQRDSARTQSICDRVLGLIRLKRRDPGEADTIDP